MFPAIIHNGWLPLVAGNKNKNLLNYIVMSFSSIIRLHSILEEKCNPPLA